jgi:hypothetical protein
LQLVSSLEYAVGDRMKDRRKRMKKPFWLFTIGMGLCILPLINCAFVLNELKEYSFQLIFNSGLISPVYLVLLVLPLPIGIGLLRVKKWAWWAILIYFPILIIYDISIWFSNTSVYNSGALFRTILGFAVIVYFLRKDISAPYFKLYPRGWRGEKREPIILDVLIDGKIFKTKDVSLNGVYIDWVDCDKELGDELLLKFTTNIKVHISNNLTDEIKAGIVRIDNTGVGLAFRK